MLKYTVVLAILLSGCVGETVVEGNPDLAPDTAKARDYVWSAGNDDLGVDAGGGGGYAPCALADCYDPLTRKTHYADPAVATKQ